MTTNLQIQEIAIALTAKNLNPGALNPDFLKYTGIIPSDWELARQPVYNNGLVQLFFNNGFGIVVQPNQIILLEAIAGKTGNDMQVAKIANQLVEKLSQLEYQGVGINPRGLLIFDSEADAQKYIWSKLLTPGSWREFGEGEVNAALQLNYRLQQGVLNLGINQVNVQLGEKQLGGILFSGSFNYPLPNNSATKIQYLQQLINNWQNDLVTFQQFLVDKFLPSPETASNISVFPQAMIS
jgi:hypothetical protein